MIEVPQSGEREAEGDPITLYKLLKRDCNEKRDDFFSQVTNDWM